MFGPLHAVVLEVLVERLHAHRAHALGDQVADRVIHHRGRDAGVQAEAVGQVGGAVELAAADVDVALGRLAERDDARVQAMDQGARATGNPARRLVGYSDQCSCISCRYGLSNGVGSGRDTLPPLPVQLVWKNSPRGWSIALVGVGAEVVALRLQQVRRQPLAAVAVVERERGR